MSMTKKNKGEIKKIQEKCVIMGKKILHQAYKKVTGDVNRQCKRQLKIHVIEIKNTGKKECLHNSKREQDRTETTGLKDEKERIAEI